MLKIGQERNGSMHLYPRRAKASLSIKIPRIILIDKLSIGGWGWVWVVWSIRRWCSGRCWFNERRHVPSTELRPTEACAPRPRPRVDFLLATPQLVKRSSSRVAHADARESTAFDVRWRNIAINHFRVIIDRFRFVNSNVRTTVIVSKYPRRSVSDSLKTESSKSFWSDARSQLRGESVNALPFYWPLSVVRRWHSMIRWAQAIYLGLVNARTRIAHCLATGRYGHCPCLVEFANLNPMISARY